MILLYLEGLFYDLRFALRGLLRDRAFTLAAVAMLALAIGLNATDFTVMDAMLFRGDPIVKRNNQLVYVGEHFNGLCCISYLDFEDWRAQAKAFDEMAFVGGNAPFSFRDGEGRSIDMIITTTSFNTFAVLGVKPILGRDFVQADELSGAPRVTILSYEFWEQRFGKRADIV